MTDMEYIKSKVRDVVDFPQKGVVFKDLTTVFKDPRASTSSDGTSRRPTATRV